MKDRKESFGIQTLPYRGLAVMLLLLAFSPGKTSAHEWFVREPPLLSLNLGAAQIFDSHQVVFWSMEYRPAGRFYHLGPWFFAGTGKDHEFYAAVGVLLNLQLGHDWVFTPGFGTGYYHGSSGLNLGLEMEFRSSLELSRRFANGQRIGLGFAHLSNGALSDNNPGTESLYLMYAFPLDIFFSHPDAAPPRDP